MASLLSWTFHIVYEIHGAVTASQLSWTFQTWVQTPCARQKPPYMLKLSLLWDLPMLHCNPHQNPDTYMDCYEKVCIPTERGLHDRNRLWHSSYKGRDNIEHVTQLHGKWQGKRRLPNGMNLAIQLVCPINRRDHIHIYTVVWSDCNLQDKINHKDLSLYSTPLHSYKIPILL